MKDIELIKCPYCECEYAAGEIFIPEYVIGKPEDIERDMNGKIVYADGLESDLDEEFICNKCGKKFKVKANISYKSKKVEDDFNQTYTTEKYSDRITLSED